jgi:hypothetical protein
MNSELLNQSNGSDAFGPYVGEADPVSLVEVVVPPGWRVRVVEGGEFRVRLSPIQAESEDDTDSVNVSPNQSRGGGPG